MASPPVLSARKPPGRGRTGTLHHESHRQDSGGQGALADLLAAPGLGARLLARAIAAFGSEAALEEVLQAGDIERLAAVSGIGARRARNMIAAVRGESAQAFLGTPDAERLFAGVRDRLAARAGTRAARNRLLLIAPTRDAERRARVLDAAERGAALAQRLDPAHARSLLSRLSPIPAMAPAFEAEVLVLVDSAADHAVLREAGVQRWASIAHLEDDDAESRILGASCILHASRGGADVPDGAPVIPVPFTADPARLAPWAVVTRFERARDTLEALAQLADLTRRTSAARDALSALDRPRAAGGATHAAGDLEALAQRILEEEMQAAETALEGLTLTGRELMRALAGGEDGTVPDAVARVYRDAARRAEKRLAGAFGAGVDAYTDTIPPRVDARAVRLAAADAAREATLRRVSVQLDAARALERLAPRIEQELVAMQELDAELALGSFVLEHGLVAPEWGDGLLVEGLLPLNLEGGAERVSYRLGLDADGAPEDTRAALLTGANSGGKTTLLEAVALLVAMAHAGLPVPAERAVVPELDAVHVYRARGERGAGALESLLLELFPLALSDGRVLVLADELEAMTELSAATEILAALLDALTARGHLAVLATHLAPHLLPALSTPTRTRVRVDGIEASGLDENGQLIVSRSPRLGVLARSTPELILRRLAQRNRGALQAVFEELAARVAARRNAPE